MKRTPLLRTSPIARASVKVARCKAKGCRQPALAYRLHCSPECGAILGLAAIEKAKRIEAKRERMADGIKREELKTLPDLIKEAQHAFNAFIRERDRRAGHACICCGEPLRWDVPGGAVDAGHYRSAGSAPHLRFNEDNCHAQRAICNRHGAGRAVDYRIGLIARIGLERVEALEGSNEVVKSSKQSMREIRDSYRQKVKQLKQEVNA